MVRAPLLCSVVLSGEDFGEERQEAKGRAACEARTQRDALALLGHTQQSNRRGNAIQYVTGATLQATSCSSLFLCLPAASTLRLSRQPRPIVPLHPICKRHSSGFPTKQALRELWTDKCSACQCTVELCRNSCAHRHVSVASLDQPSEQSKHTVFWLLDVDALRSRCCFQLGKHVC